MSRVQVGSGDHLRVGRSTLARGKAVRAAGPRCLAEQVACRDCGQGRRCADMASIEVGTLHFA